MFGPRRFSEYEERANGKCDGKRTRQNRWSGEGVGKTFSWRMNRACQSLDEVVAEILAMVARDRKTSPEEGVEYFFRGETCNHAHPGNPYLDTAFDPLLDREDGRWWKNERKLYEEAMRLNVASFTEDRTMAERVARMQHYGLPTRFADLSENALLSVCFAAGGGGDDAAQHAEEDGFIRVIKVAADKMKSFTSDIITAIAHLPLVCCANVNPGRKGGIEYLTYEILRERPGFSGENDWPGIGDVLRRDIQQVWAFKPIVNSARLRNQGGVFLAFGCRDGKEPLHPSFSPADYNNKSSPSRGIAQVGFIRLAAQSKKRILKELRWFGMPEERIYPELADVCKVLKKRYKEMKA